MKLSRSDADVFVPAGGEPAAALARVTHLCVAAHQDDIEIMAHAGIADCLDLPGKAFGGVVVTNGAGSPRAGSYLGVSDGEMLAIRREEQRKAAKLGRYAIQLQLAHPSADVKKPGHAGVAADLAVIFGACAPEIIYLHNPADKHDTHVAVFLRCLEALRALPPEKRPKHVLGCEVWRDLDWMVDSDKVALDSGRHHELGDKLLKAFDSQISGGKRYDLAVPGRRLAHATFNTSHATDRMAGITWAMDLTPLAVDAALDVETYALGYLDRLRSDVATKIRRFQ
ncbi:MAG TPA: PIG-L family deacetylase [Rariglobus sp.]|jgi:LmbE family N-acetylglucosaminyl deacetylase|nr:PIG-L family deacetylase [Rariglobus sp.]